MFLAAESFVNDGVLATPSAENLGITGWGVACVTGRIVPPGCSTSSAQVASRSLSCPQPVLLEALILVGSREHLLWLSESLYIVHGVVATVGVAAGALQRRRRDLPGRGGPLLPRRCRGLRSHRCEQLAFHEGSQSAVLARSDCPTASTRPCGGYLLRLGRSRSRSRSRTSRWEGDAAHSVQVGVHGYSCGRVGKGVVTVVCGVSWDGGTREAVATSPPRRRHWNRSCCCWPSAAANRVYCCHCCPWL